MNLCGGGVDQQVAHEEYLTSSSNLLRPCGVCVVVDSTDEHSSSRPNAEVAVRPLEVVASNVVAGDVVAGEIVAPQSKNRCPPGISPTRDLIDPHNGSVTNHGVNITHNNNLLPSASPPNHTATKNSSPRSNRGNREALPAGTNLSTSVRLGPPQPESFLGTNALKSNASVDAVTRVRQGPTSHHHQQLAGNTNTMEPLHASEQNDFEQRNPILVSPKMKFYHRQKDHLQSLQRKKQQQLEQQIQQESIEQLLMRLEEGFTVTLLGTDTRRSSKTLKSKRDEPSQNHKKGLLYLHPDRQRLLLRNEQYIKMKHKQRQKTPVYSNKVELDVDVSEISKLEVRDGKQGRTGFIVHLDQRQPKQTSKRRESFAMASPASLSASICHEFDAVTTLDREVIVSALLVVLDQTALMQAAAAEEEYRAIVQQQRLSRKDKSQQVQQQVRDPPPHSTPPPHSMTVYGTPATAALAMDIAVGTKNKPIVINPSIEEETPLADAAVGKGESGGVRTVTVTTGTVVPARRNVTQGFSVQSCNSSVTPLEVCTFADCLDAVTGIGRHDIDIDSRTSGINRFGNDPIPPGTEELETILRVTEKDQGKQIGKGVVNSNMSTVQHQLQHPEVVGQEIVATGSRSQLVTSGNWCSDDICSLALNDIANTCTGIFADTKKGESQDLSRYSCSDQQIALEEYIATALGAPNAMYSFLMDGDIWSAETVIDTSSRVRSRRRVENRANLLNAQASRLRNLRNEMTFSAAFQKSKQNIRIQTAQSFDDAKMYSSQRRQLQAANKAAEHLHSSPLIRHVVEAMGLDEGPPADVQQEEEVVYYDSDPEDNVGRHGESSDRSSRRLSMLRGSKKGASKKKSEAGSVSKMRGLDMVPIDRKLRKLDDESVVDIVQTMINERIVLIWHPEATKSKPSPSPICVKTWIESGVYLVDGTFLLPKLTWTRASEQHKSKSVEKPLEKFDLLDVCRIYIPDAIDRSRYPYPHVSRTFIIETGSKTFLMEAQNNGDRDRILYGLKLVIARLASLLMLRDVRAADEFFGGMANMVPGEAPEWAQGEGKHIDLQQQQQQAPPSAPLPAVMS